MRRMRYAMFAAVAGAAVALSGAPTAAADPCDPTEEGWVPGHTTDCLAPNDARVDSMSPDYTPGDEYGSIFGHPGL